MLSFFNSFRDINTVNIFFRMVFAVICGGVIGIERSIKNRPAGFRTHILIITGATAASLTGHYVYLVMGLPTDMSRLGAQVITGLGFIGAGTIIVSRAPALSKALPLLPDSGPPVSWALRSAPVSTRARFLERSRSCSQRSSLERSR